MLQVKLELRYSLMPHKVSHSVEQKLGWEEKVCGLRPRQVICPRFKLKLVISDYYVLYKENVLELPVY